MDTNKMKSAAITLRDNNCEKNYIEHINQSGAINVLELIAERDALVLQLEEYRRKYQREHIDTNRWKNRAELAEAIIEITKQSDTSSALAEWLCDSYKIDARHKAVITNAIGLTIKNWWSKIYAQGDYDTSLLIRQLEERLRSADETIHDGQVAYAELVNKRAIRVSHLQDRVREALDRAACPPAFMSIALESIALHGCGEIADTHKKLESITKERDELRQQLEESQR